MHKHCFQFLLGLTIVRREIENNDYANFWGKQSALCITWKWRIPNRNFSGIHQVALTLTVSESNWNLEMLVFEEGGNFGVPAENTSRQGREPATNSTDT